MTMRAMKNAERTATMSSLFSSFSPHALYDIPDGKSYVSANFTNAFCVETLSIPCSRSASTVIWISPFSLEIFAVALVMRDSTKSPTWYCICQTVIGIERMSSSFTSSLNWLDFTITFISSPLSSTDQSVTPFIA